jgi:hypothetical protein
MTRTKIFFDQPKPKKSPAYSLRGKAHEYSQLMGNETPYEGPGDDSTPVTSHKFGRSSGSNN